jgi:sterol desaturase/sphingolipid hydroxylase (fatty acid hydroxylase superfamily)
MFGSSAASVTVNGTNALLIFFYFLTVHLQHSHMWIAITGPLGYVVFSPAHHQLHHSDNPAHFNKNFGFCLSVWDWLFGTLLMPAAKREPLSFGVDTTEPGQHTVMGGLIRPFGRASERLIPR